MIFTVLESFRELSGLHKPSANLYASMIDCQSSRSYRKVCEMILLSINNNNHSAVNPPHTLYIHVLTFLCNIIGSIARNNVPPSSSFTVLIKTLLGCSFCSIKWHSTSNPNWHEGPLVSGILFTAELIDTASAAVRLLEDMFSRTKTKLFTFARPSTTSLKPSFACSHALSLCREEILLSFRNLSFHFTGFSLFSSSEHLPLVSVFPY